MQHSFFQKLVLIILAGAVTAGLYEAYKEIVLDAMESVNGAYSSSTHHVTPAPTPRRF